MNISEDKLPKVSFIIPTLNSGKTLEKCLRSITNQKYPSLEVIIVDGGSSDSTIKIASKYASKIVFENGSLGKARQIGFKYSDGEILGIFDSDIYLPSENWLKESVRPFMKDPSIAIVWPINSPPPNASIVTRCYLNMWLAFLQERLKRDFLPLPGGNSLVRREAFVRAGGFNINLHYGEDFDLMHRILCLGYKVVIGEYPIYHDTMHSIREFTKKQLIGARTVLNAHFKNYTPNFNLLYACITWSASRNIDKARLFKGIFADHLLISFKAMLKNMTKDESWMLVPLLILIRVISYSTMFLTLTFVKYLRSLIRFCV